VGKKKYANQVLLDYPGLSRKQITGILNLLIEGFEKFYICDLQISNSLSEERDTLAHNCLFYTLNYLKE
jgi:hypothetical protein